MSTLPNRKLVVSRAWALSLSKSSSNAAPAWAKTSPSPVQSMTTGAVTAKRLLLLLALEDHPLDAVAGGDRRHDPAVHQRVDVRLADEVVGDELEDLGIDGR